MSTSSLFLGLLFGSVGFGMFLYGRKQKNLVPFVCGLLLMVLPYFINNVWLLIGTCTALVVAPFVVRL